jgi:hypothetical protein
MKNKFKLTFILFFFVSSVKSQEYVDLKFRLTSPLDHTTQPAMKSFSVKGFLSNLGSDTLRTKDSLAVYLLVDSDSFMFFNDDKIENFKLLSGMTLNPGDSQLVLLPMAFDNSFAGMSLDLCLFIKPLNRRTHLISDTLLDNNKGCASIHVTASTGIDDTRMTGTSGLYPNPAKNMFSSREGNILQIMDVTGKSVETVMISSNTADCSALSAGIYFVSIDIHGAIQTEKLIIED